MERHYANGEYFRADDGPPLSDGVRVLTQFHHPVKGQMTVTAVVADGKVRQTFVTRNGRVELVRPCGCPQMLLRHARENGVPLSSFFIAEYVVDRLPA